MSAIKPTVFQSERQHGERKTSVWFNEKVDAANGFRLYVLRHSGFMENKRCTGEMQNQFFFFFGIWTAWSRTAFQIHVKTFSGNCVSDTPLAAKILVLEVKSDPFTSAPVCDDHPIG